MSFLRSHCHILLSTLCLCLLQNAAAETYYVDFENGNDKNTGLSPGTAWKRVPGDPEARNLAEATILKAGDIVRLKGGVRYRGAIRKGWSGTTERPIRYDGNADGSYGIGKAIIDGSQPIRNWKICTSAEEAHGNPLWENIYYVDIKDPGHWKALSLCGPETNLPVAQDPNPSDPFFQERVAEFHFIKEPLQSALPISLHKGVGTHVNKQRPLIHCITPQAGSTVISPIGKAQINAQLQKSVEIHAVGIAIQEKYESVKNIEFLADDKVIHEAHLPQETGKLHRFELIKPIKCKKLSYTLLSKHNINGKDYTGVKRIAAWDKDGNNILEISNQDNTGMTLYDPQRFTQKDPNYYDNMTLCVHGGHNAAVYLEITGYDPNAQSLKTELMKSKIYKNTKYALFNSVRLIDVPGEYAIHKNANGSARLFLYPPKVENGQPIGVSSSNLDKGIHLVGVNHIILDHIIVERQGGKKSNGIYFSNGKDIRIHNCEVSMVRGSSGLGASHIDSIHVYDNYIHHLPGHTKGLVFHTCTDAHTINTEFLKTSSTSLDYYNCQGGRVAGCKVTKHYGMHANGLTFYIGCRDLIIERNLVYDGNVNLTIQEAENIIIRNNIFDGDGGMSIGFWTATPFKNIQVLHNTLIDSDHSRDWATALFSNNKKPEGIVIRNNIIDGIAGNIPGNISHNIFTRLAKDQKPEDLENGNRYANINDLLIDPQNRDYRLKESSIAIDTAYGNDCEEDFSKNKRPQGSNADVGAYEHQP